MAEERDTTFDDDPAMAAYARERGLGYDRHWFAGDSTQLLRRGFMPDAWDSMDGTLPGGAEGKIAHWSSTFDGEELEFTIVLVLIPESIALATRLLCHDRRLPGKARSNPDEAVEVVTLDDDKLGFESDAFAKRYEVSADHDQDAIRALQLFDPSLLVWMAEKAPERMSFELQDGTLCVFRPGFLMGPEELDELAEAASRIAKYVRDAADGAESAPRPPAPTGTAEDPSRDQVLEAALAAVVFDSPPSSVKEAADRFRSGPFRTDKSWRLGNEAFFRESARSIGLEPWSVSRFRAERPKYEPPGRFSQVAGGELDGVGPCFLIFSDGEFDDNDNGWISLGADLSKGRLSIPFASQESRDRDIHDWYDGTSIGLWKQGFGRRTRTRDEFEGFLALARPELRRMLAST